MGRKRKKKAEDFREEVLEETVKSGILRGEQSSQPVCGEEDDKPVVGVGNSKEDQTNLFALTCGIVEKCDELDSRSLQTESQEKSALNSIIYPAIATSPSVLSQCQRLSFAGEEEEIIEMEEAEILAQQSHLCSICGKEFRRAGNVRVHMRSHGDQYKSREALVSVCTTPKVGRSYYSCPFQGCKHNRRHPNFKHLKSDVSLKNHYRRSHCAKIYACNKCGKEFSLVGDLKSHGNKCGRSTWRCSCSLTFSTRNKLLRHVAKGGQGHNPLPGHSDKTPQHSVQDLNDLSISAECPPAHSNDKDVLMMGVGSTSVQPQNEYGDDTIEQSEDSEANEFIASLFRQNEDLHWP
ncbi:hypothetical protein SUGI_0566460 [Cryptomeria japonica]|uniref:protein indeterminate-domain 7-like n=1 Tax=Cryptomeria japonica TaxID=3369 RepID=UPI002408AAAC|nr:protein indeterminate-domain 7-like [Cryptomeria japonica]GLJ28743.1 hypothetical protein SUGI_0566460 [Cryptomeria japonica]